MGPGIPPPPPPMMPGFGGKLNFLSSTNILVKTLAPPQLPQYLRKKQKYSVTEPVKKVQWSKVSIFFYLFNELF